MLLMLGGGCSQRAKEKNISPEEERGRQTYMANCMACHNADPAQPGTVGPSVKGSSRELVDARVTRAAYPAGYKPKRETKLMIAMPHLADRVDDLAAYLR